MKPSRHGKPIAVHGLTDCRSLLHRGLSLREVAPYHGCMAWKAPAAKVKAARITGTLTVENVCFAFQTVNLEPSPEKIQLIIDLVDWAKEKERNVVERSHWRDDAFAASLNHVYRQCQQQVADWDEMDGGSQEMAEELGVKGDLFDYASMMVMLIDQSYWLRGKPGVRGPSFVSGLPRELAHIVEWPGASNSMMFTVVAALMKIADPQFGGSDPVLAVKKNLKERGWSFSGKSAP